MVRKLPKQVRSVLVVAIAMIFVVGFLLANARQDAGSFQAAIIYGFMILAVIVGVNVYFKGTQRLL